MQVDNPLPSQYSLTSTFEDFFHMDLFGPSFVQPPAAQSLSSRSSSSSPTAAQPSLPPADSFFNFYMEDELAKTELLPSPSSNSSFDFFGSLNNSASQQSASESSPDAPATPSTVLSIDPQLVGSPSVYKPSSDFDEDDHHPEVPASEDLVQIPLHKVGGKGKSNRKGTVLGGGVVKKSSGLKEKPVLSPQSADDEMSFDMRPSDEDYKKLSSKEKRQLRNKISARNFRVRRKEYITALESDIAERNRIIDAIDTELRSTKSENNALRQEIDALKKSLLAVQPTPVLPPPAPLPAVSAAATVAARNNATPSSPLLAPNTNKDLPSSPRLAAARGGFWGGQGSSPFGAVGGFTPVHTTLVPEWSISGALAGKSLATPPDSPLQFLPQHPLQENINPTLNNIMQSSTVKQQSGGNNSSTTPFDSFSDMNPFTMKTLEMYRMHLWTRLAQQQAVQRQQQQSNPQQPSLTGLAAGIRPHYFTSSGKQAWDTSTSLSTLLSGKGVSGTYSTSPQSAQESSAKASAQEAAIASLASQTLLKKLGSAFWDAFAGQNSSSPSRKALDVDKVRRVLEGKAIVKIVDVDEPLLSRKLSSGMKASSSSSKLSPSTSMEPKEKIKEKCSVTDLLEESMKTLSISKRGAY